MISRLLGQKTPQELLKAALSDANIGILRQIEERHPRPGLGGLVKTATDALRAGSLTPEDAVTYARTIKNELRAINNGIFAPSVTQSGGNIASGPAHGNKQHLSNIMTMLGKVIEASPAR